MLFLPQKVTLNDIIWTKLIYLSNFVVINGFDKENDINKDKNINNRRFIYIWEKLRCKIK